MIYQLEQRETVHQPNDHGDKVLVKMMGRKVFLSRKSSVEKFFARLRFGVEVISGADIN